MPNNKPTKQEGLLAEALKKRGVEIDPQHYDNHKHVDIYIPKCNLYIEVDGLPHQTEPRQIIRDLQRDHYSLKDSIGTKRVSNEEIDSHLEEFVDAIVSYCHDSNPHVKK